MEHTEKLHAEDIGVNVRDSYPFRLFEKAKRAIAYIKANKKKLFWYWIIYHCIKGILTTSLIWLPLLYVWLGMD